MRAGQHRRHPGLTSPKPRLEIPCKPCCPVRGPRRGNEKFSKVSVLVYFRHIVTIYFFFENEFVAHAQGVDGPLRAGKLGQYVGGVEVRGLVAMEVCRGVVADRQCAQVCIHTHTNTKTHKHSHSLTRTHAHTCIYLLPTCVCVCVCVCALCACIGAAS